MPQKLKAYYINYNDQAPNILNTPHITASLNEGAEALNTRNLNFIPLEAPIKIKGKFGYKIKNADKTYITFEPYLNHN